MEIKVILNIFSNKTIHKMKLPRIKTAYSEIHNLLFKSYLPNIIHVAIETGIFEQLAKESMSCKKLSEELEINERITEALLDVLIAIGYLEQKQYSYTITELAKEYLTQSSEVNQIGAITEFVSTEGPFANLKQVLRGIVPEFNQDAWSTEESIKGIEQGAKDGSLQNVLSFVKNLPEFKKAKKMCDFAGNSGYYSYAFLSENPNLHSCVYDLVEVCDIATAIKKGEKDYHRISYHPFDLSKNDNFGSGYDFFFSSHFLYKYDSSEKLIGLLKKINKSMKMGGLFVSNHLNGKVNGDDYLTFCIVELMTRSMGFPTHCLQEDFLKDALAKAGFEFRNQKEPDYRLAYPCLILSAVKVCEID